MALRVPVSAMRFIPSLSPEEMKKIFEDLQQEMRGDKPTQAEGTTTERRSGQYGSKMKQFSRVWIEDENGKLKLVFIKTGVTDNTYSEVTWGDLKEGQEVITGEASGEKGGRSSSSNLRRGMMFMRR